MFHHSGKEATKQWLSIVLANTTEKVVYKK